MTSEPMNVAGGAVPEAAVEALMAVYRKSGSMTLTTNVARDALSAALPHMGVDTTGAEWQARLDGLAAENARLREDLALVEGERDDLQTAVGSHVGFEVEMEESLNAAIVRAEAATAALSAVEHLADMLESTPERSMSHRNAAQSIHSAIDIMLAAVRVQADTTETP